MGTLLLTTRRRFRSAALIAALLFALGGLGFIVGHIARPHMAIVPRPTKAAATAHAAGLIAVAPPLVPTVHPTALARPTPPRVPARARPRPTYFYAPSTGANPPMRGERLPLYHPVERRQRTQADRMREVAAPSPPVATATPSLSPTALPTDSPAPAAPQVFPSATIPAARPTAALVAVTAPGAPMRLRIPTLNLDTHVESVGLLGGAMDVPADPWDVAWYKLGPQPGTAGNAVIDGHLDTATGPAVFLHLDNLRPGDLLYVTAADGKVHTFKVTETANYPVDHAPLGRIFGGSKDAHLNLITCSGDWVAQLHSYSTRLVVYSTLVT